MDIYISNETHSIVSQIFLWGFIALICIGATAFFILYILEEDTETDKPAMAGQTLTQQDEANYAKINQLVQWFVTEMSSVGSPGLSSQRSKPFTPSRTMRKEMPGKTHVPIEIRPNENVWWGGNLDQSCITPVGKWEYYGSCLSYREGENDEFGAWWVVSSQRFKKSVEYLDSYPFLMYKVDDPGSATLKAALQELSDMMEELLTQYKPSSVEVFRTLRQS